MSVKVKTRTHYGEYTLEHWIRLILSKNIILPEYQRSFAWNEEKVKSFLSSLKSGAYIPPITIAAGKENGREVNLILDGQQRLTSILLASLSRMPNRKNLHVVNSIASEELLDTSEREQADKNGQERVEQEESDAENASIEWSMTKLLSDTEWADPKSLSASLEETEYTETEFLKDLNFPEDDFFKRTLGFLYIVPNDVVDSRQFFSRLFRSINYDGLSLTKEESRRALYYQNPNFTSLFEGELEDGNDVLDGLSIKQGAVGLRKIDWLRYLSIVSQYSVSSNEHEVLKKYRTESSREDFYSDFVAYIIGLPLKADAKIFEGISDEFIYKEEKWGERYEKLRNVVVQLKSLMSLDNNAFPSWIHADLWLFGLIYFVLFKNKTPSIDERLKKDIEKEIGKMGKVHAGRPNQLGFLRDRLQKSYSIYNKYVS